ncbi:tesmin tso1-like cxc domain protein [Ichthyophthirius multifiliis]|uniref:Tesmin tso1-like cxc domain protein n=1 Tax=Ichthyophthirius multifiliis TaxID=5932 RepID=G0R6F2_ICHMU|nr:tesmin tso1-like cxc domain protein [Ichthyophthirius multifiliis]EGR26953.1 tesmin tso1-like cxc domain protein [Ichthyophthirius multifiliis]|eukprot:XP_004023837.1 tesmin tso1-like cxc domain protein [Ichthyophthirius multifiliis]
MKNQLFENKNIISSTPIKKEKEYNCSQDLFNDQVINSQNKIPQQIRESPWEVYCWNHLQNLSPPINTFYNQNKNQEVSPHQNMVPKIMQSPFISQNNNAKYYVYQSPVFKIQFQNQTFLNKFLEHEQNIEYISDIVLQSCQNKQVLYKQPEQVEEELNDNKLCKRIIKFTDDDKYKPTIESIFKRNNELNSIQNNLFIYNSGGSNQKNNQNINNNLVTEKNNLFSDNNTTIKKAQEFSIQKKQQKCKKLFDSPQTAQKEQQGLSQTPSTKKKIFQLEKVLKTSKKKENEKIKFLLI